MMEVKKMEKLTEIIGLVNNSHIASIKEVIGEILKAVRDEDTSAKDIKKIIEKDPPLCAKLLKRANSAFYGYPRTIGDIQEAIVCIGFEAVRELALNQKACDLFLEEDIFKGFSRWSLWKHSVAVAVLSRMLYKKIVGRSGDDIYVTGLLHDLGIIVEDQFFDYQFKSSLEKAVEEKKNLHVVENKIFQVNHAEIGRAIMVNWDFPDEMSNAVGSHHDQDLLKEKADKDALILYVSDYLCQREKIGYADTPYGDEVLFSDCLSELKIKEKALEQILENLTEEIKKMEVIKWL